MKYSEITFKNLFLSLKHQWKIVVVCTFLFVLIGAALGSFYGKTLSSPSAGTADQIGSVDFSSVPYDDKYYTSCKDFLVTSCKSANDYIVALLSDSTITSEQKIELENFKKRFEEFDLQYIVPISEAFQSEYAFFYMPTEYQEKLNSDYEKKLEDIELNLISSEAAVELLKEMQAPQLETDVISGYYETLLKRAVDHGNYLRNRQLYQNRLALLQENSVAMKRETRELRKNLDAAVNGLNDLIESQNQLAGQIAANNAINIQVVYGEKGAFSAAITHTHTEMPAQEVTMILMIFTSLVGICSGAFFAVCYEAKKKKH